MQPSTSICRHLPSALLALAVVLATVAGDARSQSANLWEGWHGPAADGIYGLRFGMDRGQVDSILRRGGLTQRNGRAGTLRYAGRVSGVAAEIVAEFHDGGRHLRGLMGVQINWVEEGGRLGRMLKLFDRLQANLTARYGEAVYRRDATEGQLSTADGSRIRLYRGPEMEARLDVDAPDPETFLLVLRLRYPPVHPELAGR